MALLGQLGCLLAAASASMTVEVAVPREANLLRNGGFEFANVQNGMKTLRDQGDRLPFIWSFQKQKWCDLGLEQWWGEGPDNRQLFAVVGDAVEGARALQVKAPGTATTWLAYQADGWPSGGPAQLALSFMARPVDAADIRAEVSVYEGDRPMPAETQLFASGKDISIAGDSWQRQTLTVQVPTVARAPRRPAVQVRLSVLKGVATFDAVQLEYGAQATDYSVDRSHYVTLSVKGVPSERLPTFHAKDMTPHALLVRNTSGRTLNGTLLLTCDDWEHPARSVFVRRKCVDWKPGSELEIPFNSGGLAPNGYVILASLEPYFGFEGAYDSKATGWGHWGDTMLRTTAGLRFAVFPGTQASELFGVGNGMVGNDGRWSGHSFANAVEAKAIHPVVLGEADPFKAAIIGAPYVAEPSSMRGISVYSPEGRKELKRRAREFATRIAEDASVCAAKIENEGFFVNGGDISPDEWGDADFRAWVKRRYKDDLAQLNAAWGTGYSDWSEVVQPVSALKDATIVKQEGAAIDWNASLGKMTSEAEARLRKNPSRSLDWFRWRAYSSVRFYADFIAQAKRIDRKTLYGNNYPWPNYFPHIIWPQWRTHDIIMLDMQYVCGFPKTLGTNEEMMDILEQAESLARGERPIWGREIYVQPNYPGEMAALQNWAMIAHGMSVPMTFAWRPYADYNREIFKTGPKSWLRADAPPMWFMIDTDGTRLPVYDGNARSAEEIARFHAAVDGNSLRRIPGDTAIFLSRDTSAAILYETMDKPYDSPYAQRRAAFAAAARYAGARIEYFDERTLSEVTPEKFSVLVAPGEYVLGSRAVEQLKAYAAKGGTVIAFDGFNSYDANLRKKAEGGFAGFKGKTQLVVDAPGRYEKKPHASAEYADWCARFFSTAPIVRHAWWENESPRPIGEENCLPGTGRPLVEVVIRRQVKTGRRFAFVLNKGGAGRGTLKGPDFAGVTLQDALTGAVSPPTFTLEPFGCRIFELK